MRCRFAVSSVLLFGAGISACSAQASDTLIEAVSEMELAEHCATLGTTDRREIPLPVAALPPSRSGDTTWDCARVHVSGYFRWLDMGTAALYADVGRAYAAWSEQDHSPRIYVGDWPGDIPAPYFLTGSNLTLEGTVLNYCQMILSSIEAGNPPPFVQELGLVDVPDLCNSFPLDGYLLFDVNLVSVEAGPGQRIRGEINRDGFGDLRMLEANNASRDRLYEEIRHWTERLGQGERFYLSTASQPATVDALGYHRTRPFDVPDLYGDGEAMRTSSGGPLSEQQIAIFQAGLGDITAWDGPAVYGCICLQDECADAWPLDRVDLPWMPGAYICTEALIHNKETGQWSTR